MHSVMNLNTKRVNLFATTKHKQPSRRRRHLHQRGRLRCWQGLGYNCAAQVMENYIYTTNISDFMGIAFENRPPGNWRGGSVACWWIFSELKWTSNCNANICGCICSLCVLICVCSTLVCNYKSSCNELFVIAKFT